VLPLSKTHHAAFDRELFTIDQDYRLRVDPDFETQSDVLQRTILDQKDECISPLEGCIDTEYLSTHNRAIGWI
jgi:putative restriction endonuclease